MSLPSDRPVTSKSRGICRYYNTPRGCYAGAKCKFLHGEAEKYTPFDKGKTCRYYAAGFCRRGADCWFLHTEPRAQSSAGEPDAEKPEDDEYHFCCICYEKPVTYGLLEGCSHIFCMQCIGEWRDRNGKSEDMTSSGAIKKCPFCRVPCRFVTPSSRFYPDGDPGKAAIITQYKASMAKVPCSHFQESPPGDRFCPFGKDCFYQHLNDDGTPFVFPFGVDYYMQIYNMRQMNERYNERRRINARHDTTDLGSMLDHLDDISATIVAMRAAIPSLATDFHFNDDLPSPISEEGGDHTGTVIDRSTVETMQRLVILMANLGLDDREERRPTNRFGTVDLAGSEDDADGAHALSADAATPSPLHVQLAERITSVSPAPLSPNHESLEPSTIVFDSNSLPVISPPGAGPASDPHPRFSTVVRGRGRFVADFTSGNIDDARPLPDTVVVSEATSEATTGCLDYDEEVAREVDIVLCETDDLGRRVRDVLNIDNLGAGSEVRVPQPTPEEPPQHEEVRSQPLDLEVLHDAEPPFLTDGRGRVVWSNTTTARHRESRRGRPSASVPSPAQHKAEDAIRSPAEDRALTERRPSRARLLTHPQTVPEGAEEHPVDEARRAEFVTDGRGHVISTSTVQGSGTRSDNAEPTLCYATEVAAMGEAPEADVGQSEEEIASAHCGSRALLGRILDAVGLL